MPAEELMELQMPHSVMAEQSVLGSMLIDERCVPAVMERLRPDDFYLRQNRALFDVMFTMFNRFETIDPVTVVDRMKQAGAYDDNTVPYLRQLMEITPTAANVLEYVDIVADKALLRRVGEAAGELGELVRAESGTAAQILEAAEQRIYAIRQGRSARGLSHISSVMNEVWETIKERQAQGGEFPGISTGLVDLDRRISGLNDSDLIIVAGRPGMGKSSLAMNIGVEAAKQSGKSVAVFSLEMSKAQLGLRLVSTEALIDNKKLTTGRIAGEEEWGRVALAVASLSQAKMYLDDDASLSVAEINAKCRRIDDLGLIIIDYLQLMTSAGGPPKNNENRQQIVSDMSRALKLMAKELNVPVICASQLSRANESRSAGQRRPMLSDLRESGAIEQDADIVMFIHRESYYEDDTENPNVAECIVAKNRHGETGTVMMEWRPEFTVFRNLAYQYDDEEL
ncbi:MAG: replicative DNA helicase [Oscillospiraceae bacterium]|jgi:replicative DNA helicase|nr:replicative DNA helicase [Oscillospiraceae bacterium]